MFFSHFSNGVADIDIVDGTLEISINIKNTDLKKEDLLDFAEELNNWIRFGKSLEEDGITLKDAKKYISSFEIIKNVISNMEKLEG